MDLRRFFALACILGWCLGTSVEAQVISGVITNGGQPVRGLRVYVSGLPKPLITNREGRYSATVSGPGTYTVTPYPSSSRFVTTPIRRTVDIAGAPVSTIDFAVSRLDARSAIRGRIRDANGQPISGVEVQVMGIGAIESDANGIYAQSEIQPGRYSVTPRRDDMTFIPAVRSQNLVAGRATRISVRGIPLSAGPAVPTYLSGVFDSKLRLTSGTCPILPESVEGRAVVYQKDRQVRLYLPRLGYGVFGVGPAGFSGAFEKRKLACLITGDIGAQYSSPDAAAVTGALKVVCLGSEQCNGTFGGTFTRR